MSKFPGLFNSLCAIACIVAYTFTDSIGYMFAAVIFVINAATLRIIAAVKESA